MLLRYGVANYRSICDYQEVLLTASNQIARTGPTFAVPVVSEAVVPVVVIYGANASGKSNLISSIGEMRKHVVRSHTSLDAAGAIPRQAFALDATRAEVPTRFDCTFVIDDTGGDELPEMYEYGFEFVAAEYRKEWLRRTVRRARVATQTLFERETSRGKVTVRPGARLRGENKVIAGLTRPNSLFLSAAAQNNHPQLTKVQRTFAQRWTYVSDERALPDVQVAELLTDYPHMDQFIDTIRQADLGIVGTDSEHEGTPVEALEDRLLRPKRFRLSHSGKDGSHTLDYHHESSGTRTLTVLLIHALRALSSGSLLVIDELDASLHPHLTKAFVSLFKGRSNPHGAQLIFATHDPSLLRDHGLELDEVWVADKGGDGASRFTPLTTYRLRSRDDLEKAYTQGRVGGVPVSPELSVDFAG